METKIVPEVWEAMRRVADVLKKKEAAVEEEPPIKPKGVPAKKAPVRRKRIYVNRPYGPRITVLEGQTVTEMASAGFNIDNIQDAANAAGLSRDVFALVRKLMILRDDPRLTSEERRCVVEALTEIDQKRQLSGYKQEAKEIVTRYWANRTITGQTRKQIAEAKRQREVFLHMIHVISATCGNNEEVVVPVLDNRERLQAIEDLAESMSALGELLGKLKRND